MKKSELKQIIREEIQKVLEIEDPYQNALNTFFNKDSASTSGEGNILRPKKINLTYTTDGVWYKTDVDGDRKNLAETKELLERLTKLEDLSLKYTNDDVLTKIQEILAKKGIELTWNESMDVS